LEGVTEAIVAPIVASLRNLRRKKSHMIYTTQARVEAFLDRALTANELINLDIQISAMSDAVGKYLNRDYIDVGGVLADVVSSTRYFDGSGERELFIDDYISLSSIDLVDNALDSYQALTTDLYHTYPLNATVFSSIYFHSGSFSGRGNSVKVTAKFSSGIVPDEVIYAVTTLVAQSITSTPALSSPYSEESIEGYSYKKESRGYVESSNVQILSSISHLRKILF